ATMKKKRIMHANASRNKLKAKSLIEPTKPNVKFRSDSLPQETFATFFNSRARHFSTDGYFQESDSSENYALNSNFVFWDSMNKLPIALQNNFSTNKNVRNRSMSEPVDRDATTSENHPKASNSIISKKKRSKTVEPAFSWNGAQTLASQAREKYKVTRKRLGSGEWHKQTSVTLGTLTGPVTTHPISILEDDLKINNGSASNLTEEELVKFALSGSRRGSLAVQKISKSVVNTTNNDPVNIDESKESTIDEISHGFQEFEGEKLDEKTDNMIVKATEELKTEINVKEKIINRNVQIPKEKRVFKKLNWQPLSLSAASETKRTLIPSRNVQILLPGKHASDITNFKETTGKFPVEYSDLGDESTEITAKQIVSICHTAQQTGLPLLKKYWPTEMTKNPHNNFYVF
ncbi:hypothetical protein HK096_005012, partial [Nowakowskiella sp. JEL0078]